MYAQHGLPKSLANMHNNNIAYHKFERLFEERFE